MYWRTMNYISEHTKYCMQHRTTLQTASTWTKELAEPTLLEKILQNCFSERRKTYNKWKSLELFELGITPRYFSLAYVKYRTIGFNGHDSVLKYNEQPFKFPMSTEIRNRQNVKMCNFDTMYWISNKASILSLKIWNITYISTTVTVQCPKTMCNLSKLLCPIRPRKPKSCKRCENRHWRNGHDGHDLADFDRITTKSWFIMANSRHNCVIVNQNVVGVGPNSVMPVRLCPLCHGWSSERLTK